MTEEDNNNDNTVDESNRMIDKDADDSSHQHHNHHRDGPEDAEDKGDNSQDDLQEEGGIPQDKGYSWVICFSVCFIQMLVLGNNRAVSTWFVDIRSEFQQTQTVASLTLSMFALSLAISSLVTSNIIIKLVPNRVACVVASVTSSLAVLGASQSPHIGLWLACYVLRGLSCGVLFIIPISKIGYYFKTRRALASSIASMGPVLSNIVFPPLASFMRQTFGLRGALLLMVGIELHMIPLSMLLRPHTSYTKRQQKRGDKSKPQQTIIDNQTLDKITTENEEFALKDLIASSTQTRTTTVSVEVEPINNSVHGNREDKSNLQNNGSKDLLHTNAKTTSNKNNKVTTAKYQLPVIENQHQQHSDDRDAEKEKEKEEEEEEAIKLYNYSSSAPSIPNAHLDLDTEEGKNLNHISNPHSNHDNEFETSHNQSKNYPSRSSKNNDNDDDNNGSNPLTNTADQEQKKPLLSPMRMLSYDESSGKKNDIGNHECGSSTTPDKNNSQDHHHLLLSSPKDLRKQYHLRPQHSRTSHCSSQMSIAALGSLVDVSYIMVDTEEGRRKGGNYDDGDEEEEEEEEEEEDANEKPTFRDLCQLKTFFDVSLFKLWMFRMLAVFSATSAATYLLIVYTPVLALEAGLTKQQGSLLLTIGGSVDFVTRPFIGWLADKKIISKEKMVAFSLLIVAILTQFGRWYTTFQLFIMFTVLGCLFGGFRANLFHAIVFDIFGPERAPKVFALSLMFTTVFMAANHPIFGALIDTTGSHVVPLHYIGAVIAFSSIVLLHQPLFARWDRQNAEKEKGGLTERKLAIT